MSGAESSDDLLNESSRFELIEFGINSVSTHAVYRFSLEILIFIQRERVGFRLNITQGNIKKKHGENRKWFDSQSENAINNQNCKILVSQFFGNIFFKFSVWVWKLTEWGRECHGPGLRTVRLVPSRFRENIPICTEIENLEREDNKENF